MSRESAFDLLAQDITVIHKNIIVQIRRLRPRIYVSENSLYTEEYFNHERYDTGWEVYQQGISF